METRRSRGEREKGRKGVPPILCSFSLLLCGLWSVLFAFCSSSLNAAVYDPFGNQMFEGKGEAFYSIDATYASIEDGAAARWEKKSSNTLKAMHVTSLIGEREKPHHVISVGSFPILFSRFTLNKRQSNAIGWSMFSPVSRGRISAFISKCTSMTLGGGNRWLQSSSDWYMAGARAEANLGVRDASVGNYEFAVAFPSIGISYVNKYFTDRDLSRTSNFILGVDICMKVWEVALAAERAWLIKNWQSPLYKGKRSQETAEAWFIDANRRWGPLVFAGEYTYIDPFYNASDFVDDDDDGDGYLDGEEPFLSAVATEDDLDGDRVKDWEDDFLLFHRDPPKFRLGLSPESMDFNSNGQPDDRENDNKPDYRYDYEEGSRGYRTYLTLEVPFARGLSITQGYYKKSLILGKRSARAWYALVGFMPKDIPKFGTVQLQFMTKRAHDIIPDDLIELKDNLGLQNSLSNIVTLIANYKRVKELTLTTRFKYQYDVDFHGKRRVIDTMLINQARYNINVWSNMVISPAYRNDRIIGYTIPREEKASIDGIRQAFILQAVYCVSEDLKVSAGAQYLTYRDLKNPFQNFNRKAASLALALALQGEARETNMGMLGSLDYVRHDLSRELGGSYESINITVKLFLLYGQQPAINGQL